jgi:hypothetical protein
MVHGRTQQSAGLAYLSEVSGFVFIEASKSEVIAAYTKPISFTLGAAARTLRSLTDTFWKMTKVSKSKEKATTEERVPFSSSFSPCLWKYHQPMSLPRGYRPLKRGA